MAPILDQHQVDGEMPAVSTATPVVPRVRLVRSLRWLAIPILLGLLVTVGMATTATEQGPSSGGDESSGSGAAGQGDDRTGGLPDTTDTEIEPVTVTAGTDRGDVDVTFDTDGVVRLSPAGTEGDTGTGPTVDLVPGTESGFTMSEDGRLEPVAPGQLGDDGIGFRADSEGVIVEVPGDSPILLRPDGERGGVSASDVDLDYEPLAPDENGELVLDDGTTLSPIENPAPTGVVVVADAGDLPWTWVFSTIAAVAVVSALTGYLLHRTRPEPTATDVGFMVTAGIDTMSDSGFEEFLHELAIDPDPARAVRLGFHAAEQGLGVLPPRRKAETPNEWATRVGADRPELAAALATLSDVFARARFGPAPVGDGDRDTVIEQLRRVRSSGPSRSSEPRGMNPMEAAGTTRAGS